MLGKRKKTLMIKVIFVFMFFVFANAVFAARIVPMGKVSIIKDGNVIGEFNQEALLPEGFLLRCETKCVVQLDDVDMEVEPRTSFSVSSMANRHDLMVQQGTIYYSINESSRPLHFDTPFENVTMGVLYLINAELKGYVHAVEDVTEIGVLRGGTMMLEMGSGEIAILPGNKVMITSTDSGKNVLVSVEQGGLSTNTKDAIGGPGDGVGGGSGTGGGGPGGGGDPGGGDPGGGDPGGGDPGGGDPGGGDPGGGDPGGGDPGGGKGGGNGGGKGGGNGGGKGGGNGGGKGGGKR